MLEGEGGGGGGTVYKPSRSQMKETPDERLAHLRGSTVDTRIDGVPSRPTLLLVLLLVWRARCPPPVVITPPPFAPALLLLLMTTPLAGWTTTRRPVDCCSGCGTR
jgi:hypothetical protein